MTEIVVVSAGTGPGCLTDRLADWMGTRMREAAGPGSRVTSWRLADHAETVGAGLLTCTPDPGLAPLTASLAAADVLVVASPVHNASYSALFKAFFDQQPRGILAGVPTILGIAGGSQRHGLVLDLVMRPYLATLRALVVPTAVDVHRGDWLPHGMPRADVDERIAQAAQEAAALAPAAATYRPARFIATA